MYVLYVTHIQPTPFSSKTPTPRCPYTVIFLLSTTLTHTCVSATRMREFEKHFEPFISRLQPS